MKAGHLARFFDWEIPGERHITGKVYQSTKHHFWGRSSMVEQQKPEGHSLPSYRKERAADRRLPITMGGLQVRILPFSLVSK